MRLEAAERVPQWELVERVRLELRHECPVPDRLCRQLRPLRQRAPLGDRARVVRLADAPKREHQQKSRRQAEDKPIFSLFHRPASLKPEIQERVE